MFLQRLFLACLAIGGTVTTAFAGDIYEVTSTDGTKTVKYEVWFGPGKDSRRLTAFDPQTKKFVYLQLMGEEEPKVAAQIWDYSTGRTINLYKFRNAANPLPIIPSMEQMKICPLTGDKNLKSRRVGSFD